jgi:hypothetical protein
MAVAVQRGAEVLKNSRKGEGSKAMKTQRESGGLRQDHDQPTLELSFKDLRRMGSIRFIHTDKIVGVLGEYPELTKAVRDGDVATVRILCAQLFDLNTQAKVPLPTPETKEARS